MAQAAEKWDVETLTSVDASVWNGWVSQAALGTLFQTTFWSNRLGELWDCHPYFFVVRRHGVDLPALVLLGFDVRSDLIASEGTPVIFRFAESVRKLLGMRRRFQWFGQPALIDQDARDGIYRFLLSEVENFCRSNRIPAIAPSELPDSAKASIPAHWNRKQWATFVVDLHQDDESLWRNLKKTARKAIRTAREDGIVVRQINSLAELRDYYDFVCQCSPRYGKRIYGFIDLETMWRHFRPHAVFETFVAEKGAEPLAGLSVWGYNGLISELGSFQSERSFLEKLYGSDLIKWEVLQWGSRKGHRAFDLASVNPDPRTPKEQGIRQFKEKWGGEYRPYWIVSRKNRGGH
jgi:hypothetical protein